MKTNNYSDLADPFFGTETTVFPPKTGLASTWFFPKAQTGNTHPGACLPFGMVSVCAYSGAYVTGYGRNDMNYNGQPPLLFSENTATGFSHFHQSGTGKIGSYYNYFLVSPSPGPDAPFNTRYTLSAENASPGYYAATLRECDIRAEFTVGACGAIHRYTFPAHTKPRIGVNLAAGGLAATGQTVKPSEATITLRDNGFEGYAVLDGIPIYVCGMLRQRQVPARLFAGSQYHGDKTLSFTAGQPPPESFGVAFEADAGEENRYDLFLAFSLRNAAQARENLSSLSRRSFEETRATAATDWEHHLARIQVTGEETDCRLFYSALYHSLIKPCHLNGETPSGKTRHPFFADFATLWDQYKTAIPLILTFYPDTGSRMVNSLLATADTVGEFSNAILLSRDMTHCAAQARGLTHHVLADARIRDLPGINWQSALDLMIKDLEKESNRDFHETGIAHPFTHTLDLAGAAFCTAFIAAAQGDTALRDRVWAWTSRWKNVYDPGTGILGSSKYYEGGAWNYSFRLLHNMAARIALHGGEARFINDLKRFFGYGAPPALQQVDPKDSECMARGFALNRFEGFNNEPDMETPYAFMYAGRHDHTCEVIRSALQHQFHPGRGGLPGNNDSGGLTSAYVWNAIGIFPVTGQPVMLIGSPIFESIRLTLPHSDLRIIARGASDRNLYVQSATFNHRPLEKPWLTTREFLNGGDLILTMGPRPNGWATNHRPPSFTHVEQL